MFWSVLETGTLDTNPSHWRTGFQPQAFSFEKGSSSRPALHNLLIWISPEGSVSLLPFPLSPLPPSSLPLVKGAERTCSCVLALVVWQSDTMSWGYQWWMWLPHCENTYLWQRCGQLYGFFFCCSYKWWQSPVWVCSYLPGGGTTQLGVHWLPANAGVRKNTHCAVIRSKQKGWIDAI